MVYFEDFPGGLQASFGSAEGGPTDEMARLASQISVIILTLAQPLSSSLFFDVPKSFNNIIFIKLCIIKDLVYSLPSMRLAPAFKLQLTGQFPDQKIEEGYYRLLMFNQTVPPPQLRLGANQYLSLNRPLNSSSWKLSNLFNSLWLVTLISASYGLLLHHLMHRLLTLRVFIERTDADFRAT